jgi:hypothetical protein
VEANDATSPLSTATSKPLGSLAQAARGNELKQAQRILIVIGALTAAVNGYSLYNLPREIQQAIQLNQIPPANIQEFREAVTTMGYLIYGGAAALGVLFVIFGLIIHQFPVAITITSLVLYVLATAIFGLLSPTTLAAGLIIKVIIIFALFRAIKAARAYEGHTQKPVLAGELME